MRIIDEKGRLFGKINVIDFSVVMFFITLIPVVYFGYRLTKKTQSQVLPRETRKIEFNCNLIKLKPEILELIQVGDREKDQSGAIIGEVLWLGQNRPYQYNFNLGFDIAQLSDDSTLRELPARIRITADIRNNIPYYKDKQVMLNSPLEFVSEKYTVIVVPDSNKASTVEEEIEELNNLSLFVTFKGLNERMLKLISVGDKQIDDKGEIIAEILSIGTIENDIREVDLGDGKIIKIEDSEKKQAYVKLAVKCKMKNIRHLYFNDKPIKNNSLFEFKTNKYVVKGIITPMPVKEKWLKLTVKFTGIIPELAKVVMNGDNGKDFEGRINSALTKVISNKSSEVLFLKEDRIALLTHPFQRDIVAELTFLCSEINGILYFNNYPIKLGNAITFTTDLYSISGTIIEADND